MMKTKNIIWVICCFALLLSACSGKETDPGLEGKVWTLTDLNGNDPISEHMPTILFEDGQISGNSGCNHYGGSYQIRGETLSFEGLYSTEMACIEPAGLMEQERSYFDLLNKTSHFETSADALTIFTSSGEILVFKINPENPSEDSVKPTEASQAAVETSSPEPVQSVEPPPGFREYRDPLSFISIYIPEKWVVTGIVDGKYAIFQSYPEDKYIGGEMLKEGDTKCDLNIQPKGTLTAILTEQWEADAMLEIVSQEEFLLNSGLPAQRFVIDSMGSSTVFAVDIDQRAVLLTCYGDYSELDTIAATLGVNRQ